jgi:hypothetical protein
MGGVVGDSDCLVVGAPDGAADGKAELGTTVGEAVGGTTHCTVGETRPRAGSHVNENVPVPATGLPGNPPSGY